MNRNVQVIVGVVLLLLILWFLSGGPSTMSPPATPPL